MTNFNVFVPERIIYGPSGHSFAGNCIVYRPELGFSETVYSQINSPAELYTLNEDCSGISSTNESRAGFGQIRNALFAWSISTSIFSSSNSSEMMEHPSKKTSAE